MRGGAMFTMLVYWAVEETKLEAGDTQGRSTKPIPGHLNKITINNTLLKFWNNCWNRWDPGTKKWARTIAGKSGCINNAQAISFSPVPTNNLDHGQSGREGAQWKDNLKVTDFQLKEA